MQSKGGSFRTLIAGHYSRLSANQKKVADFLLQNMREAAFLSVTEIGARCGASKATVVRFAQELGFNGFMDLRDRMAEAVNSEYAVFSQVPPGGLGSGFDSLFQVARLDVENINETFSQLDRTVFLAVVESVQSAGLVYSAGLGISYLLAEILAYTLVQVGLKAVSLRQGYQTFPDQIPLMSERDVLLVFSFPPYSEETLTLAARAKSAGIPVIAVTNSLTAPVAASASLVLPVRSENLIYCNSIASSLVVINALATEIAIRKSGNPV